MGLIERKRLAIEKGKFVLKPIEKKPEVIIVEKEIHHYHVIKEQKEEEPEEEDDFYPCWNCENIVERGQKYCEYCGIEL